MKPLVPFAIALCLFASLAFSAKDATAAPDSQQLAQCQRACVGGKTAIENFCRSLPPDPKLKTACFALTFASLVFCTNWCYAQWGI